MRWRSANPARWWRRWHRITRSAATSSPPSKQALIPTGAKLVFEEYAPIATTDFTASYQRIFDALAKYQGRKIIFLNWAGGGNPMSALKALDPSRLGISVATGGNILPALVAYKDFPGLEGSAYYYYEIPKNPMNDWLVAENKKRFNGAPPDFFTCAAALLRLRLWSKR